MKLSQHFDAVLMLTWSDWKTEPRSNRYHYAARFARELPVLFVQPSRASDESLEIEATELEGVEICHAWRNFDESRVGEFLLFLRERQIRKPLVWVYSTTHYHNLIEALPRAFRVFHATENYLVDSKAWDISPTVRAAVGETLAYMDLVIGVTETVVDSIRTVANYSGAAVVVENGCDAAAIISAQSSLSVPPTTGVSLPIAIFQGGINQRLDAALLNELMDRLPDWRFWFCGAVSDTWQEWPRLRTRPNLRYFGNLQPDRVAELMHAATVGIIPFVQDPWIKGSLPLKAYEYVASGLPVVTVPIDALQRDQDAFVFAETPDQFADAMRKAVSSRYEPQALAYRRKIALENSYDGRFERVVAAIKAEWARFAVSTPSRLNVAMLYDERETYISTIHEYLDAFRKYSRHATYFVPATGVWPIPLDDFRRQIDLSLFDVVILNFSVRLCDQNAFSEGLAAQLESHWGLKALFIQDEYEYTETARKWMDRIGFDVVFTCVPESGREFVYPSSRFPTTDFLSVLTGYVPENLSLDRYALPLPERDCLIGYRGRKLPHVYGTLGFEKYRIGIDVRRLAEARGLTVDIEVENSKRIYGANWYKFLGSVRATLGTESGSNVFDFDGSVHASIEEMLRKEPDATFEQVHGRILAEHEKHVHMNQVSPKIFEAIRLRTALVLFEGHYSGVVQPNVHYIPLRKDYSNIDEVFEKLNDIPYLTEMTERAYRDVIESGLYSYRRFVEQIDAAIDARVIRGPRYELFASPVIARGASGRIKTALPTHPLGFALSTHVLGGALQREQVCELASAAMSTAVVPGVAAALAYPAGRINRSIKYRVARLFWRSIPAPLRALVWRKVSGLIARSRVQTGRRGAAFHLARALWKVQPRFVRDQLVKLMHSTIPHNR